MFFFSFSVFIREEEEEDDEKESLIKFDCIN